MPTISVIIPTYNGARYIRQAIDSVLAQSYSDYEIIVVDDGSTDNTAEILWPYGDRITYLYQSNQKLPTARNNGITASKGKYLAFLDSDDLFLPDKLEVQARYLDERPDVGLVASGWQYIDDDGWILSTSEPQEDRPITLETILFGGLAPVHAVLLRREWFGRVGGFDPQFAYCEDMDLWYRLALAGCPMVWVEAIVCQYRIHTDNMSRSPGIHFNYYRCAMDKAFADPRLPKELLARQAELDANLDLSEASRLVAGGWTEDARERVLRAVSINPRLKDDNGHGLAEIVVGLRSSVWSDGRFAEFVATVMADEIPALDHTMAIVSAKKCFYNAYNKQRVTDIRRAWFDIIRRDPRWLVDRGGWSILGQSFVGFKQASGTRE